MYKNTCVSFILLLILFWSASTPAAKFVGRTESVSGVWTRAVVDEILDRPSHRNHSFRANNGGFVRSSSASHSGLLSCGCSVPRVVTVRVTLDVNGTKLSERTRGLSCPPLPNNPDLQHDKH